MDSKLNFMIDSDLRKSFYDACAKVDLRGSQVLRAMIKDFISGANDEKENEQEKFEKEFQSERRNASEERRQVSEKRGYATLGDSHLQTTLKGFS